eukprot:scaffold21080_cov132-Skeletonema_dohrnii-CCMP3373.AAC.1
MHKMLAQQRTDDFSQAGPQRLRRSFYTRCIYQQPPTWTSPTNTGSFLFTKTIMAMQLLL